MKTKSTWLQIVIIYYYFRFTSTNQELKNHIILQFKNCDYITILKHRSSYISQKLLPQIIVCDIWMTTRWQQILWSCSRQQRTADVHRYEMLFYSSIRSKLFIPIFHFLSWSTKVHPQRNPKMWTQTDVV